MLWLAPQALTCIPCTAADFPTRNIDQDEESAALAGADVTDRQPIVFVSTQRICYVHLVRHVLIILTKLHPAVGVSCNTYSENWQACREADGEFCTGLLGTVSPTFTK